MYNIDPTEVYRIIAQGLLNYIDMEPMQIGQHILENLNTAVLLFDEELRLKQINPAGEVLLAISAKQALETEARDLIPADDAFITTLQHSLNAEQSRTEREVQLHQPHQQTIIVDCTCTPLRDDNHHKELLVELFQRDRHLRIAREEQLLAQYHTSRTLLRGIAHEINNPLGGLRGAAQLLEQELDGESLREYTNVIIREADRLQNLLRRMLGPSTLPQKRTINIHEVLERVRTLAQAEHPQGTLHPKGTLHPQGNCPPEGINIIRNYDPSIPELYADPDQLIQAVLNIVRNAMQALDGNGEITLRSRTQRQFTIGNQRHKLVARIDISDNGPGIPPNLRDELFYPMVTGRADGTGLGLSIAQSLVNQHGGLIECTSKTGETVFTLFLPLERDHA